MAETISNDLIIIQCNSHRRLKVIRFVDNDTIGAIFLYPQPGKFNQLTNGILVQVFEFITYQSVSP